MPSSCVLRDAELAPGDDAHVVGRRLAERVLAEVGGGPLAYDGTRPIADGACISIAHTRTRVVAIAGRVARLGIDLVDDADRERVARIAPRFLDGEGDVLARFAATEAGLKALGLGLLDGGVFDRPVRVSLVPPRIAIDDTELALVLGRLGGSTVAIAYA